MHLHHHLCFINEIIFRHCAFFHGLYGNLMVMFVYALCHFLQTAGNNVTYSVL